MAFTKGAWVDALADNGTDFNYTLAAPFTNADAAAFVAYWSGTLVKTVTANCTIAASYYSATHQNVVITEPEIQLADDVHVEMIDDIKTTEDALVARTASIATEYSAIATYATGKITLAAHA